MATVVGDLLVKLSANDTELKQSLDSSMGKMKEFGDKMKEIGKSMSLYVTAPLAAMGTMAVMEFDKAEKAEVTLKAALAANGEEVDKLFKRYASFASGLQNVTTVGDDTTLQLLQIAENMGLTGDAAERAAKNAIGMQAAFDVDAQSAIRMTAALEQGNGSMLARYIPALKGIKDQSEMTAKAQGILSKAFEVAKSETNTGAGAMKQMKNTVGDLMEQFGKIISDALMPLVRYVKELAEKFQQLSPETKKVIVVIAGLAAVIGPLLGAIGVMTSTLIPALVAGFAAISPIILPIIAVMGALTVAYKAFNIEASRTSDAVERLNGANLEQLKIQQTQLEAKIRSRMAENRTTDNLALSSTVMDQVISGGLITGIRKMLGGDTDLEKMITQYRAINIAIANRKKAEEEASKAEATTTDTAIVAASKMVSETEKTIGIINNLQKEIDYYGVKQKEALDPKDVKKYGDAIEELQHRMERVKAGLPAVGREDVDNVNVNQVSSIQGSVSVKPQGEDLDAMLSKVKITKETIIQATIDIGAAMRSLASEGLATLAESVGEMFSGGGIKASLDNVLGMLADFASQFGKTLIAAGTAVLIAQTQLAINPAAAIGIGFVLVAAAAAVKSSLGSGMGSSGGGQANASQGGGGQSIEGLRTMRQDYVLNVNGTITGDTRTLAVALDQYATMKSL